MRRFIFIVALFFLASSCKKEEVTEGKRTVEHLKKVIKENGVKILVPVLSSETKPWWDLSLERGKYTFIDDQFLSVYERSSYMTYNLSLLIRYEFDMVNISGSDSKEMALFLYFSH